MNLYQYVRNRVINRVDSLGTNPSDIDDYDGWTDLPDAPKSNTDANVTAEIQIKVQSCIKFHLENLSTKTSSAAKKKCGTAEISVSYNCYAFMYNTVAAIVGGTNVSCTTTVTSKWDCCEKKKLWSSNKTHCSFEDVIDIDIGITDVPLGITYVGEWVQ